MVLGESAIGNPLVRHLAAASQRRKSHDNVRKARTSKHARETHYEFTDLAERAEVRRKNKMRKCTSECTVKTIRNARAR